jgi:hypothetical protein
MAGMCGSPFCSKEASASCGWEEILNSSTCTNHILAIGIATLIVIVLAIHLFVRIAKSRPHVQLLVALTSPLQLAAVVFNGCLGLIYLGLALWMLGTNFSQHASVYLPHRWLVNLSQGFSLSLISFAFSIRAQFLGATFFRVWSVLLTTYAAFVCCTSVVYIVADKVLTIKACLDVLSLPGALLFLVYEIWHVKEDGNGGVENALYKPLNRDPRRYG